MRKLLYAIALSILLTSTSQAQIPTFAFGGSSGAAILTVNFENGTTAAYADQDQGWWSPTVANFRGNTNVISGSMFGVQWNDFFVFDLTGQTGHVVSASLILNAYSVAGTPQFALWDVATPISTLENVDSGPSAAIYTDLGSGTMLSALVPLSTADSGNDVAIAFNAAGIAAIDTALGGQWAIGGSANNDIPEPAGLTIIPLALAGLAVVRYRTPLGHKTSRSVCRRITKSNRMEKFFT